jgi:hypothetical protein
LVSKEGADGCQVIWAVREGPEGTIFYRKTVNQIVKHGRLLFFMFNYERVVYESVVWKKLHMVGYF